MLSCIPRKMAVVRYTSDAIGNLQRFVLTNCLRFVIKINGRCALANSDIIFFMQFRSINVVHYSFEGCFARVESNHLTQLLSPFKVTLYYLDELCIGPSRYLFTEDFKLDTLKDANFLWKWLFGYVWEKSEIFYHDTIFFFWGTDGWT